MNFNKNEKAKLIAVDTMSILQDGFYINKNRKKVMIVELVDNAIKRTEVIKEKDNIIKLNLNQQEVSISVISGTTIETIVNLRNKGVSGNIVALNFASATKPGGGFLNGAVAQEESIARVSALYPCLVAQKAFYEYHKANRCPLYNDEMIYSPDVPIIKNDKGELLINPITCSFITSPAVNAKVARERGITQLVIKEAMIKRIELIIELALMKKPEVIILGAFGCGVFGNKPEEVAEIFKLVLNKFKINNIEVIFAIYDGDGKMVNIFKKILMK